MTLQTCMECTDATILAQRRDPRLLNILLILRSNQETIDAPVAAVLTEIERNYVPNIFSCEEGGLISESQLNMSLTSKGLKVRDILFILKACNRDYKAHERRQRFNSEVSSVFESHITETLSNYSHDYMSNGYDSHGYNCPENTSKGNKTF